MNLLILSRSKARFCVLGLLGVVPRLLAGPTVTLDHGSYFPGETITAAFSGGPGNKLDWIGIYPEGVSHDGSIGSTIWRYVNNTQIGSIGLTEGTVSFPVGLQVPGIWDAYFLLNDGYTGLATNQFNVVDPGSPLIRANKGVYGPGESISITFTNGPGHSKDWIGLYQMGQTPGSGTPSLIWSYVDGTQIGVGTPSDGVIHFPAGLNVAGAFEAIFLENDGYNVLAREPLSVRVLASDLPRVVAVSPVDGSTHSPPSPIYEATLKDGAAKLVPASVKVLLDGINLTYQLRTNSDGLVVVAASVNPLLGAGSTHTFTLTFKHSAGGTLTNTSTFTVGAYVDLQLPAPLYFESFDALAEGQLPPGWTSQSFSEIRNPEVDFGNLDSAAYAGWTVVKVDRFSGSFVTYSDTNAVTSDYQRVLNLDGFNVVNGQALKQMATGKMLFGDSGYRNGSSQVLYLYTRDYDLSSAADVHLLFHSLYEQNQDSFGAVEYSIDAGVHWLSAAYYLATSDLITNDFGGLDVSSTLTTEHNDVARYTDAAGNEVGGNYGAFVAAPLESILPTYINGRTDDDSVGGKRVEVLRLAQADHRAKVRVRLALSGTDSWYWGVDDFGLYSLTTLPPAALAFSTIQRAGTTLTLRWSGGHAPFKVQQKSVLTNSSLNWSDIFTTSEPRADVMVDGAAGFFRIIGTP